MLIVDFDWLPVPRCIATIITLIVIAIKVPKSRLVLISCSSNGDEMMGIICTITNPLLFVCFPLF